MKVITRVTEILSREVEIDASTEAEAIEKVQDMYKKQEVVLDWGDFEGEAMFEVLNDRERDIPESRKNVLIKRVVDYMIDDERRHYEENNKPRNHIYLSLLDLKKSIN